MYVLYPIPVGQRCNGHASHYPHLPVPSRQCVHTKLLEKLPT